MRTYRVALCLSSLVLAVGCTTASPPVPGFTAADHAVRVKLDPHRAQPVPNERASSRKPERAQAPR